MNMRAAIFVCALVVAGCSGAIGYKLGYKESRSDYFNAFGDCVMLHQNDDGWIAMKCVLEGYEGIDE